MQILLEAAGVAREVDVVLDDPEACVADLVRAVTPGVPDVPAATGITVDGRWFGPDLGLDEAGLYEGAEVRLATGPVPVTGLVAGSALAIIAGPDAGRTLRLTDGERVVGRDPACSIVVDDPSLSGRHAALRFAAGVLEVTDLGSRNGTWVDGVPAVAPLTVGSGGLLRMGATHVRVLEAVPTDQTPGADWVHAGAAGLVPFNRPPRPALPPEADPVAVPEPPKVSERTIAFNILSVILPLLMGGALVYFTRRPMFAIFMLLSPLMAIGNYVGGKRRQKRERKSGGKAYAEALAGFDDALDALVHTEVDRREELLCDLAEAVRRTERRSTLLWQRRPTDPDFLHLRAGTGDVPWEVPLDREGAGKAPEERAEALVAAHATLPACPVTVDLSNGGVVGIVGDRQAALALARSLVVQAAVHHGPADLGMAVLAGADCGAAWDWAKWLPHVRGDDGATRLLAAGRDDSDRLLARLLEAGTPDEEQGRWRISGGGEAAPVGRTLLLVLDDVALTEGRRAPARLLLAGKGGPVAGIVIARTEEQLPAVVTTVVDLHSDLGDAQVRRPQEGTSIAGVVTAGLGDRVARRAARNLARWEDPEYELTGAGLPAMVRLLPLLGMEDVTPADVEARWATGRGDLSLRAPIGVSEDGVAWIDLVRDGPHGLVGGTTGSGKSELLRSFVAGLAVRQDPDHLVFVLVDYKGGSAFDECARLPHTVGVVTDLDGHLGERALASLEAELHFRERLLRDAGATDLPEYQRLGTPLGPLPRLVVVIDEFATLAAELPDFLGALVGIAQRGRSLGVHMILATQRPSGAVNANIKANTNLRIALRVQDRGDSTDVIDVGDAASIRREQPGRAYVRLGPGEVVAVQTALSTAADAAGGASAGVALRPFTFGPLPSAPAAPAGGTEGATDLTRLVEAARTAFAAQGAAAPREPWLPMLAEDIALVDILECDGAAEGVVPFSLVDEPEHQRQGPSGWRPAEGHLALFGMVGSGTTTAMVSVATALASTTSADDCHVYALDFGGGALAPLAALPHVGAVVGANDREGQLRLVRLLRAELDRRRDLSPLERAAEPRIVVLIDGIGAFLAEHDAVDSLETGEAFRRVFSDGPGVDIVFIVTGDRPGELPMRLGSLVGQRLLFRLADPSDFAAIGIRPKDLPAFLPGRALDERGLVVQVGRPPQDLDAVAARLEPAGRRPPPPIVALPAELPFGEIPPARLEPSPILLHLGVSDADLGPVALELHPTDHAVIAGQPRSGVTSTLALIAALLRAADPGLVLVGVCEEHSRLYDVPALDAAGRLADLAPVVGAAPADTRRWVVLVDDAGRVEDVDGVLGKAIRSGRPGLHVIAGGRADDLRGGYGHWTRDLRQSRTGLLLQPNLATDGEVFGLRLPRRLAIPLVAGRGFVVNAGDFVLAQIALPPAGPSRDT